MTFSCIGKVSSTLNHGKSQSSSQLVDHVVPQSEQR